MKFPSTYVFDIETNGFLDQLTTIHCLVIKDCITGKMYSYHTQSDISSGLNVLMNADIICGHNVIAFDIPAIQKVFPLFKPRGTVNDTMIMSRLFWPDIRTADYARLSANPEYLPRGKYRVSKLVGSYKLEAFGYRMGILKGEYTGGWDQWSQDMQDYCEQDVEVTYALYRKCLIRWGLVPDWVGNYDQEPNYVPFSVECVKTEHGVQEIISQQERRGFAFDVKRGAQLYVQLCQKREELRAELQKMFPPWMKDKGKPFIPKRNNKTLGYTAGVPVQKQQLTAFEPSNNHHIIDRLRLVKGWVPTEFTEKGHPKIDDSVVSLLPYPEAKLIAEYLMVQKRISQLSEGDKAWLKVEKKGRIHGGVITLGAVTRRMTHLDPNVAQVPSIRVPFGMECRSLFTASEGMVLVDVDADALELRLFAGYLQPYDQGEYINIVLSGDKSEGTDMHSVNCRALGMDPKKKYLVDGVGLPGREIAKTWFYAFLYGAGGAKLGWILGYRGDPAKPEHWTTDRRTGEKVDGYAQKRGNKSKKDFMENLPALGTLIEQVQFKAKTFGFLTAIDGGKLYCRSTHSALNTLLQSAGAIVMKKGLLIFVEDARKQGLICGDTYHIVANIHDEWVFECQPQYAEQVKELAVKAIKKAGEAYDFPCVLAGNGQIGPTWADVH